MSSSSSMNLGSQGYGSHYFGNGYHAGGSKKRPRRRYDEIERLYPCSWPGCTKSYGTLNHLNAHVAMQKHGPKRSPSEFKDMRKAWRKQKKEDEQRRQSRQVSSGEQSIRPSFSGSSYASMPSSELTAGSASALPLAGPPSLSGFASSGTSLPGMAQMPRRWRTSTATACRPAPQRHSSSSSSSSRSTSTLPKADSMGARPTTPVRLCSTPPVARWATTRAGCRTHRPPTQAVITPTTPTLVLTSLLTGGSV